MYQYPAENRTGGGGGACVHISPKIRRTKSIMSLFNRKGTRPMLQVRYSARYARAPRVGGYRISRTRARVLIFRVAGDFTAKKAPFFSWYKNGTKMAQKWSKMVKIAP